jgi:hypothetical protein
MIRKSEVRANYDEESDVMYLDVGEPEPSYADGVESGVYVRRGMFDERITGAIIEGFSKKSKKHLASILPRMFSKYLIG